ncbi:hypothetical protein TWF481_012065 [Arthrobotrys musiformis]|uniref:Uncharacterized protein n=1 Tax=Arthrobotrys musiformis TaxID=47236 RepID=A0AAV9VVZ8_9PEZI
MAAHFNTQNTRAHSIHDLKFEIAVVSRDRSYLLNNDLPAAASSTQIHKLFVDTFHKVHSPFVNLLYDVTISVGEVEILGPDLALNRSTNPPARVLSSRECPHMTAAFRGHITFPDIIKLQRLHPEYIWSTVPQSRTRSTFVMSLVVNQRKMLCWILFGIAVSLFCGVLVACTTKKVEIALGVVMVLFEMINLAKGYI